MNKHLVFVRLRKILENLHRFNSVCDDSTATNMGMARALGFIDGIYMSDVIDFDEMRRMQELAYNAHEYARRAI